MWGKTGQRIEVPVVNERQKQTYFGTLNFYTQEFVVKAYEKGNSESTIAFVQYLLAECAQPRLAVIWDGASYHRSQAVRDYLDSVNQPWDESDGKITCIRLAANAPEQNPALGYLVTGEAVHSRVLPSV
ncbi:MAG TPA: transposase [Leptolyngbyaceae cyanobacterium]